MSFKITVGDAPIPVPLSELSQLQLRDLTDDIADELRARRRRRETTQSAPVEGRSVPDDTPPDAA